MNHEFITKINELLSSKTPFVISTIVKFIGSTPRKTEAKMITYLSRGKSEIFGTIGGGKLEYEVIRDVSKMIENREASTLTNYKLDDSNDMTCGGEVEVFHELTSKQNDLYIFGAGHVAQALTRTLIGGPLTLHVIDERSEWALSEKIPETVIRHNKIWSEFTKNAIWDKNSTFVIIMTHDHKHDTAILNDILKRESKFIGLMGSKNKWNTSQKELIKSNIDKNAIKKVTCPIGEKDLGKGPTEIAIGVARQLLKNI